MPRFRLLSPVLCALVLGACSVTVVREGDAMRASEAEAAQIRELTRRFSAAYMAGDVETMVATYTPDAVIFPIESEMITGTDAIRRYWTVPAGTRVTLHRSTATEIRVDGDHAYEYGVYEVRGESSGTPWGPNHGKYVAVWRRTPQGWRMHLDIWNPRALPAPAP